MSTGCDLVASMYGVVGETIVVVYVINGPMGPNLGRVDLESNQSTRLLKSIKKRGEERTQRAVVEWFKND